MTPNDALMELLTMIDAAQGASAHRIIAVMPWYGYARQDKKSAPREPISARIVAKALESVGVDRVLTMDLHAGQVQGFFDVPLDHMTAMPMLTPVRLGPRVRRGAGDRLARRRPREDGAQLRPPGRLHLGRDGEGAPRPPGRRDRLRGRRRRGKTAVLVDDMIDTAGTLTAAAHTVLEEGAARVIATATHGVFSGPAYERLAYENSKIEQIVVTDTMPLRPGAPDNIR